LDSRVKWFNNELGFGFIENSQGDDIFVHYSAIKMQGYKTLEAGQRVHFNLIDSEKGLLAREVEFIEEN